MNRTPLHYAYTLPTATCSEVAKLLTGADESACDCKNRKPAALTGSDELKEMAELLVSAEQAPADTEQKPADTEQAPAATEQVPAGTEQAPAAAEQAPTDTDKAPAAEAAEPPAATE